ncbi:hypothetical protein AAMO2058_001695100 [Amorphochlora amoebiformis]
MPKKAVRVAASVWGKEVDGVAIEACKFSSRAKKLEKLIKKAISSTHVEKNTEKPRKGAFEVLVNGEMMVSLTEMKRPFAKLVDLSIEELADKCVEKLGGHSPKAEEKEDDKPKGKGKKGAKKKASAVKRKAKVQKGGSTATASSRKRKKTKA